MCYAIGDFMWERNLYVYKHWHRLKASGKGAARLQPIIVCINRELAASAEVMLGLKVADSITRIQCDCPVICLSREHFSSEKSYYLIELFNLDDYLKSLLDETVPLFLLTKVPRGITRRVPFIIPHKLNWSFGYLIFYLAWKSEPPVQDKLGACSTRE